MEILHFKDLGDTASFVMNAVVLVLGECLISTYLWGISTILHVYSCIAMNWEMNWEMTARTL